MLGDAQIVVLIILVQKAGEAFYASYNAQRLINRGAHEAGRAYFPVVVVCRFAWLAAVFLIVSPETDIIWPVMGVYALLQGARCWLISLLGRFWTLRIIVPPEGDGPLVSDGPYRYLAHPYQALVMLETFLLPLVFGAWQVSVVMTAVTGAVLYYQIVLEEETLEKRRAA